MKKKEQESQKAERFIQIQSGKTRECVKTWQYYSIVNITRQCGMNRVEAEAIANWALKAETGETWPSSIAVIRIIEQGE